MVQAPAPYSASMYLLEDHARTLFPLTTTQVVVSYALPEIRQHIQEILDPKTSDAFLVQQRCHASKVGYHLRRTMALDPVAAYFIYELLYNHRAMLNVKLSATRKILRIQVSLGKPIAPSISYGKFRAAIRDAPVSRRVSRFH